MKKHLSPNEYADLSSKLDYIQPLHPCCRNDPLEVLHVEPLNGRNTLEVDRTCIVKCDNCGKLYWSDYD